MIALPNHSSPTASRNLAATVAVIFGSLAPAAVLLFMGQPAAAQTARTAGAAEIRIDLQAKSVEAVQAEITMAARKLCRATTLHSPAVPRDFQDCRKETEAQAMAQLKTAPTQLAKRD